MIYIINFQLAVNRSIQLCTEHGMIKKQSIILSLYNNLYCLGVYHKSRLLILKNCWCIISQTFFLYFCSTVFFYVFVWFQYSCLFVRLYFSVSLFVNCFLLYGQNKITNALWFISIKQAHLEGCIVVGGKIIPWGAYWLHRHDPTSNLFFESSNKRGALMTAPTVVKLNQTLTISDEMGDLADMFEQHSSWSCGTARFSCLLLSATSVDKLAGDIAPFCSSFCSQSICKLGLWLLLLLSLISSSSCWICCKKSKSYFWVAWQILAPLELVGKK